MKRLTVLVATGVAAGALLGAAPASAHVHGVTPLLALANDCGVTDVANTGANRAQSDVITGLIPQDVGSSPLTPGDGGFSAPVGCAR